MKNELNTMSFSEKHPKLNILVGLALVIILLFIAIKILIWFIRELSSGFIWVTHILSKADAVIVVALITGTVSIFSVLFSSVISRIIDYKKNRREYLYQKREQPYTQFIDTYYKIQMSEKMGKKYTEQEMLKDMAEFSKTLTLWGSNRVVKLWVNYRTNVNKSSGVDSLLEFEKILFEIRRDMGFRKLKKGTLLKFFINDLDETLVKRKGERNDQADKTTH